MLAVVIAWVREVLSRMGFLSVLRAVRATEREARVLVVGLDGSGKTTVVAALLGRDTGQVAPTLGFNIDTWVPPGTTLSVCLWDVGGQSTIRAYWRNYYSQTDALVWVVDSTDRMRLDVCRRALEEVLHAERLQGCPVLVLCNKQDVGTALTVEEVSSALSLASLCENREHFVLPCSAIARTGVHEAFALLAQLLSQSIGECRAIEVEEDLEGCA